MECVSELFLVQWRPEVGELTDLDGIRVAYGLWLVRAAATRSELYSRVNPA